MRFAARVLVFCLSLFLSLGIFSPGAAQAQTISPRVNTSNSFAEPNIDANVARNQHTLTQSVLNEMLFAIGCQLTGIDLSNPTMPCLNINPLTHKLGYAPTAFQDSRLQPGGVLGALNNGIASLYTPSVTTTDYTRYLAGNFGLVKPALAAPKNGFEGLSPLLNLWKASRDVSYFFLIAAFAFIGLGVMLRVKIDPRTVMTIQNQIPRVIIAIILITFSYPIAAAMTDLMWATTYMGINVITNASSPTVTGCGNDKDTPLASFATSTILGSPFSFANRIFLVQCDGLQNGIFDLSKNVSNHLADLSKELLTTFLGLNDSLCPQWLKYTPTCMLLDGVSMHLLRNWVAIAWSLVIFIVIIIALFRIWFELLKAYALILVYVILAPIFISVNLLPKRPLGFGKWIRTFFANLALFPATVAIMLLARIFIAAFETKPENYFIPPLIGNPNMQNFGGIVGFALLLMAPQTLSLLREKLGVPPVKQVGAAMQTFNAGRQAVGAVVRKPIAALTKRNATTDVAEAPLSRWWDKTKETNAKKISERFGNRGIGGGIGKLFGNYSERLKNRNMRGYYGTDEEMRQAGYDDRQIPQRQQRTGTSPTPPPAGAPTPPAPTGGGNPPLAGQPPVIPPPSRGGNPPPTGTPPPVGSTPPPAGRQPSAVPPTGSPTGASLTITIRTPDGRASAPISVANPGQTAHDFVLSLPKGNVPNNVKDEVRGLAANPDWQQPMNVTGTREMVEKFLGNNRWQHTSPTAKPEPEEA